MNTDLSLVTTDDLIEELKGRCDNCAFVLEAGHTENDLGLATIWNGSPFACLGLLDFLRHAIKQDIRIYPKDEL